MHDHLVIGCSQLNITDAQTQTFDVERKMFADVCLLYIFTCETNNLN